MPSVWSTPGSPQRPRAQHRPPRSRRLEKRLRAGGEAGAPRGTPALGSRRPHARRWPQRPRWGRFPGAPSLGKAGGSGGHAWFGMDLSERTPEGCSETALPRKNPPQPGVRSRGRRQFSGIRPVPARCPRARLQPLHALMTHPHKTTRRDTKCLKRAVSKKGQTGMLSGPGCCRAAPPLPPPAAPGFGMQLLPPLR